MFFDKKVGLLIPVLLICSVVYGSEVKITTEDGVHNCIKFAIGDLKDVLKGKNIGITGDINKQGNTYEVIIKSSEHEGEPESFSINIRGNRITVTGSDDVGTMYGVFELAEDINILEDDNLSLLKNKEKSPFLEFRADNMFLTLEAERRISGWFYDEDFWERYFKMLARARYNYSDMHAMYDIYITYFPNMYQFFLESEKYPRFNHEKENKDKNLKMLNKAISIGEKYGVKVAMMNYNAEVYDAIRADSVKNVKNEELVDYTRWCVKEFINRCPGVSMIGFRIGESHQKEKFFEQVYIKGIEESDRKPLLYTRTWGAQMEDVRTIGKKFPGRFFAEIKYVGEQLGAPYHAIQEDGWDYSYREYMTLPKHWEIIWQIRSAGTHRIFRWGNYDFIKRTVLSCRFGNGAGFSLEPITAYSPQEPSRYYKYPFEADYIKYMFERNWNWYLMWGRLAYDPGVKEDVFERYFKKRFGKHGDIVYKLLNESSKIIPLIFQHHCIGYDHRAMAPEFETGNGGSSTPDDINKFCEIKVLDSHVYVNIKDYVNDYLDDTLDGRITPLEVAEELKGISDKCMELLGSIKDIKRDAGNEYKSFKSDVMALCELAKYYYWKNKAGVSLLFFNETGDYSRLISAEKYAKNAYNRWKKLSEITGDNYRPIIDTLRMHTGVFTWDQQLDILHKDLVKIKKIKLDSGKKLVAGHVPLKKTSGNTPIKVGFSKNAVIKGTLYYRTDNGGLNKMDMKKGKFELTAEVPLTGIARAELEYYFEINTKEDRIRLPDKDGTYYKTMVTQDNKKPVLKLEKIEVLKDKGRAKVFVTASDENSLEGVYVYYKPLPSEAKWIKEPKKMEYSNGQYSIEIPVKPEGILYSFMARDNSLNIYRYPDIKTERPYLAVEPWNP